MSTPPRTRSGQLGYLAGTLIVLAGCSGGGPEGPAAEVSDSAGVRLVTYDLEDGVVRPFANVGHHDLEIGVRDGPAEYTFARIVGVRTLADRSIVVADAQAANLRVFDAAGRHLRSLGGKGEGPGEFSSLRGIAGVSGDTIFAFDSRAQRVTTYTSGGELVGARTLTVEGAGRVQTLRRLDDGTYLATTRYVDPAGDFSGPYDLRIELDSIVVQLRDLQAADVDTLEVLADREWVRAVTDAGGGMIRMLQTDRPLGGAAVVATDGVDALVGEPSAWLVRWRTSAGADRSRLRLLGSPQPVSSGDLDAYLRGVTGDDDPEALRRHRERFADVPMPEFLPRFGRLVVDSERRIWVSEYRPDPAEVVEWLVFESDGALLGSVVMPSRLRVYEITADHVLGIALDDFDVPYVRRHPILPSSTPSTP